MNNLYEVSLRVVSFDKEAPELFKDSLDEFLTGLIGEDGRPVKSIIEEVKPDFRNCIPPARASKKRVARERR